MIKDPNFTAKTHYFAKRLEELRQLHEIYRNLAKQAPRGRNSIHSPLKLVSQISEEDDITQDEDSSVLGSVDETESKVSSSSVDVKSSTLSSLKFNGSFGFDWKSLLPEELDLHSEFEDVKNEEDETASEVSKDTNDPLYDIQSDIMPYLPSNYVNLTNLSASPKLPLSCALSSPQNEIKVDEETSIKEKEAEQKEEEEEKENELQLFTNIKPIPDIIIPELPHVTVASLSDDENNVKQVKAKKEKRKRKLSLLSKSNSKATTIKTSKKEMETDPGNVSAKLSWSRFFGSPKQKNSLKENSKKPKNSSKQNGKANFIGKSSEKPDKKFQKEKSKEPKNLNAKEEKQKDVKSNSENELQKSSEKTSKYFQKVESERHISSPKSSKSPSRRSSDSRSGSSSSNRSQRRSESSSKGQQPQQPIHSDTSAKSLTGVRYQGSFQWDSHLQAFQPSTTISVHGYDSGTDSGVGLKVPL